jgi:hypothetical protein
MGKLELSFYNYNFQYEIIDEYIKLIVIKYNSYHVIRFKELKFRKMFRLKKHL